MRALVEVGPNRGLGVLLVRCGEQRGAIGLVAALAVGVTWWARQHIRVGVLRQSNLGVGRCVRAGCPKIAWLDGSSDCNLGSAGRDLEAGGPDFDAAVPGQTKTEGQGQTKTNR